MAQGLDPYQLHHGPYHAPALRCGDRATCLFRDAAVILLKAAGLPRTDLATERG
jgi:hypothetical protein